MDKPHFPTFLLGPVPIPASGARTCLQDPTLKLVAGGILSWHNTELKTSTSMRIPAHSFSPCCQSSETLLEVQEARHVQLKHTEMNLKNLNFGMISTQEHQQPGLFTNHCIFLNRKKEESV